jgi:hypothetical protein
VASSQGSQAILGGLGPKANGLAVSRKRRRQVVVSKNEDRMLRHVAREYHRVRARLVRLVRDAVKRRKPTVLPRMVMD